MAALRVIFLYLWVCMFQMQKVNLVVFIILENPNLGLKTVSRSPKTHSRWSTNRCKCVHIQGMSFLPERNAFCSDDHVLHDLFCFCWWHCTIAGVWRILVKQKCLLILMCFRHSLNCSASKLSDLLALGTEDSVHSKERIIYQTPASEPWLYKSFAWLKNKYSMWLSIQSSLTLHFMSFCFLSKGEAEPRQFVGWGPARRFPGVNSSHTDPLNTPLSFSSILIGSEMYASLAVHC